MKKTDIHKETEEQRIVVKCHIFKICCQSVNNSFMAMPDVNIQLIGMIKSKAQKYFESREKMLFYKDSGIIFKGKEGMLITDKSIYFIKRFNKQPFQN